MKALSANTNLLGQWAWDRMACRSSWTPVGRTALGEIEDGKVLWAAVFERYEPNGSVQIHIAIDNPKYVTRRAISCVFEYAFYQLEVHKVIGIVNSADFTTLSFDLRLGFIIEAVVKDAYDKGDMYILSMTQEQCRWLRGKEDGFSFKSTAAA